MSMRPGQLQPNEFETAILKRFAKQDPSLSIDSLHVLSREFTGVGSFTKFLCGGSSETKWDRHLGLGAVISMPGVPSGLGAVLFCTGNEPNCLEISTFGDEHWDGIYDGFVVRETV
jgi:hypothetical protein